MKPLLTLRAKVIEDCWKGVVTARKLLENRPPDVADGWRLEILLGRLVEVSGGPATAALTCVASVVLQAQFHGEPVAWIGSHDSIFFPPDFAATGIDLDTLPVIRVRDSRQAARAADHLLRSRGFAVVVLDLAGMVPLSTAAQTRLTGLASRAHSALVCLTRRDSAPPVLGPLVSLRLDTAKARTGFDRFTCAFRVTKDKRLGPGRQHEETCHGPDGLC